MSGGGEPLRVSKAAARRFLAERHMLLPPRQLPASKGSVLALVERLGSLQFDPVDLAGRSHEIVCHARIDGFEPRWVDELLYAKVPAHRALVEQYNGVLVIVPTSELPYYRRPADRRRERYWRDGTYKRLKPWADTIMQRITNEGVLSSADFGPSKSVEWSWGKTPAYRAALEMLQLAGLLHLARREGSRRWFDLAERLIPRNVLERRVSEEEQIEHTFLARHRDLGLASANGVWVQNDWPLKRKELVQRLVGRGALLEIEIAGLPGVWRIPGPERFALEAAMRATAGTRPSAADPNAVTLLSPLDPLIHDRKRLEALYNFHYRWEIYTPERKRIFGPYAMPIHAGDQIVGRIQLHRDARVNGASLSVDDLWWERGARPNTHLDGLATAIRAHQRLLGMSAGTISQSLADRRDGRSLLKRLKRLDATAASQRPRD
ncbi:MAG: winged helix-turn-helix domain-containing protein [Chloroflexi bacterium]|nr:MAG: winged helix-turn-helix domain-containing protein [Chloroflexota bacterium]